MAIAIETRKPFRVEQLYQPGMPEKFVEIVEGELIIMTPAGWEHNRIASHFETLFRHFCETRPELEYGGDNDGFLVQREPDDLFSPDASLFRKRPRGESAWLEFSPEIAVEVLSPSNSRTEIALKRQRYFDAGSEQVWIANPETQTLEIHFRDGRTVVAKDGEIMKGEGIAQGMEIDLRKIFTVRGEK